ncbi:MAG TPA: DUF4287 domain-containing protein [Acidimicrobiales bacterium]|nr:DUF4287 domain-containing protein [Acidimicrobiales bacterium]
MTRQSEYEFLFVVDGVSVEDDSFVGIITEHFDGLLSWNRGLHRLAISGTGADAMGACLGLVTEIQALIPGMRILRLDPDLVGIPDIAERTGHTRQNVQQWVNGERNADRPFPPPEGSAGRSLVWRWHEVNEWLRPLGLDDQTLRPTREESVWLDAALIEIDCGQPELHEHAQAWQAAVTSLGPSASAGSAMAPTMHKNLIARIPAITGRDLPEWFRRLESGPPFLRCEERAHWLSDEHGLSHGYASAIVHEYETRRRKRLLFHGSSEEEADSDQGSGSRAADR